MPRKPRACIEGWIRRQSSTMIRGRSHVGRMAGRQSHQLIDESTYGAESSSQAGSEQIRRLPRQLPPPQASFEVRTGAVSQAGPNLATRSVRCARLRSPAPFRTSPRGCCPRDVADFRAKLCEAQRLQHVLMRIRSWGQSPLLSETRAGPGQAEPMLLERSPSWIPFARRMSVSWRR